MTVPAGKADMRGVQDGHSQTQPQSQPPCHDETDVQEWFCSAASLLDFKGPWLSMVS